MNPATKPRLLQTGDGAGNRTGCRAMRGEQSLDPIWFRNNIGIGEEQTDRSARVLRQRSELHAGADAVLRDENAPRENRARSAQWRRSRCYQSGWFRNREKFVGANFRVSPAPSRVIQMRE